MQTDKKRIIWGLALTISLAVFLACAVYFAVDYFHYRSIVNSVSFSGEGDSSHAEETKNEVDVPVNFGKLQSVNDDIYAWINIPGTIIDYPILQSDQDDGISYYLTHNVNREDSKYGAIYTQYYNSTDFNDFNTLIYGHNMLNGTMFGTLKKYRDREYFEKNNVINIYMPGRILKYEIFAAYVFDDRHILLSFDFENEDDRQRYLDVVHSKKSLYSNFDEDITVDTDDRIITLSTCTSNDDERYLVQGVLVYDSDRDS